jgi:hypothetical protein
MVTYKVRPGEAVLNEQLIADVFTEARALELPAGFRYQAFLLEDGVSFVHVVEHEDGANPIPGLPAFERYTAGVRERCDEQPRVSELRSIGSLDATAPSPGVPRI